MVNEMVTWDMDKIIQIQIVLLMKELNDRNCYNKLDFNPEIWMDYWWK